MDNNNNNMKQKLYYKVLQKNIDGNLVSYAVHGKLGKVYVLNEWTLADAALLEKNYGLTVFRSIEEAKSFTKGCYLALIYKCKIGSIISPSYRLQLGLNDSDDIYDCMTDDNGFNAFNEALRSDFSYLSEEEFSRYIVESWPPGTEMTDKVMLIEKI
jgi:hypothetical protein